MCYYETIQVNNVKGIQYKDLNSLFNYLAVF